MANLLDYVNWRADLLFSMDPFNTVDNVIFSEISYMDYENIVPSFPSLDKITFNKATTTIFKAVDKKDMVLGLILPYEVINLADAMKSTNRYSKVYLSNYINKTSKKEKIQFSAMCFHINKNLIYIAFRGTDDTLIGWQEDLDMVHTFPVPSQKMAVNYINEIACLYPEANFVIGGHSKGGNLATYGAIYCKDDIKDRIIKVYNNDGPGFIKGHISLNKYEKVKEKITSIIPKESIIGVVFDDYSNNTLIVDSKVKGLYQHDAFKWEVKANNFVLVDKLSDNSKKLDIALTNMLSKMEHKEKEDFASNIFEFITILNKNTLIDCQKDVFGLLKYVKNINSKNRMLFMELMYNLVKYKQI